MLTNRYIFKPILVLSSLSLAFGIVSSLYADEYSLRKYPHVKSFYATLTPLVIEMSHKHKLPAASILAVAGLESGYGTGYVSQITGNVLSLGAFKGDKELPSLYLPYSKGLKKILFDPREIRKRPKKDLSFKSRPKSLKRDYRPSRYAGTKYHLELLKYNELLRKRAHRACLNDFATRWITLNSNIKAFKNARRWLNRQLYSKKEKILDSMSLNVAFINKIGGISNSFNHRQAWPKKVKFILKRTGLVALINDIKYKNMSFQEAWENKK